MLSTQEFQSILLSNGGDILDNINPSEVQHYHYIRQNLNKTDVATDKDFQFHFSVLHKLERKRLDIKLMKRFFHHLQKEKHTPTIQVKQISRKLFGIRPLKFGSKHFTLLTQFLHTIHENYPIYNKEVAELFDEENPKDKKVPFFRKFNRYFQNYDKTIELYRQVLQKGKLYDLLRALELKYKPFKDSLSHSKNLDLLVRSAGDLKRQGKLLRPSHSIFVAQ